MASPYYVGDDVPLRFAVLEEGKPIYPTRVTVAVFNPIGTLLLEQGTATVTKNEVNYVIPSKLTVESGEYTVVFRVWLFNLGIRKHIMKVKVNALPTGKGKKPVSDSMEVARGEKETTEDTWDISGLTPAAGNPVLMRKSW